jgi:hypothetical protein
MKIIFSLLITSVLAITAYSQKTISKSDYDAVFKNAVSVTNAAFPFVFTVATDMHEGGKVVSTETEISERQAEGVERQVSTLIKNGNTLQSYTVMVGFGENTYCSRDGRTWKGPQQFACPDPENSAELRLYRPRTPKTAEYTVAEKKLDGKTVKVYREYNVFESSKGKKDFMETIATVDSKGFFIEVFNTEGTLDPRVVTLTRKQTWKPNAKFAPVVAPK